MLFDKLDDVESVNGKVKLHTPTKLEQFFEDFEKSGIPIGEIRWKSDYRSAEGCRNTLNEAIKRFGKYHLKIAVRGERVFIFNTLAPVAKEQ